MMNRKYILVIVILLFSMGFVTAQTSIPISSTSTPILAITLQPSLDSGGIIKVTSIMKAELLNTDGSIAKTAVIANNVAKFNLSRIHTGDYFIRINDLSDDLVPTRIDNVTKSINQFVGQKLRVSIIGSISDPTYKIDTFSKGQGKYPIVRYFDGTSITPENYAYIILSLKTDPKTLEIRTLGTGSELNKYIPDQSKHPDSVTWTNTSFGDWILSGNNHPYNYNGSDNRCNMCHTNLDQKPTNLSDIKIGYGWCYRCHYGKGGINLGFIDTTATVKPQATIVETTTVQPTITPFPTGTQKAPGFDIFLAISILVIVSLIRKFNQ